MSYFSNNLFNLFEKLSGTAVRRTEEFPAYSLVLLRLAFNLRTVIVTAAVHRGFGRQLLTYAITNFLNLPALGRRQPPYIVLRLCGDLCFW